MRPSILLHFAVLDLSMITGTSRGVLVFEDDFTGPLNTSKWHVQSGAHLHGVYNSSNAYTNNSNLILQTIARNQTIDGVDYFVSSGAVDTTESLLQQYGTWEARLRMPNVNQTSGFRLHSSMWLFNQLPWVSSNGTDCGGKQNPEIDLIEYDPIDWTGRNASAGPWAEGHFHAYFDDCHSDWAPISYAVGGTNADFYSDFRVWQIVWSSASLLMSVDDTLLLNVSGSHWLQGLSSPLYFLLTNAVMTALPPTAADVLPQTMEVDYVRIYAP